MNNSFKLSFFIFTGFICVSCESTRLISNFSGYDYKNQTNLNLKVRPEWITKIPIEEDTVDGKIYHFIGSYSASEKEANGSQLEFVRTKAAEDARIQVSNFLNSEIKSTVKDFVQESGVSSDKNINGKKTSVEDRKSEDELYIESYFKSSSSFGGLIRRNEFWECYESQKKKDRKTFYKSWIHYTISQKDIDKAKSELEHKEKISEKEKRMFENYSSRSTYVIKLIQNTNFLEKESEYKNLYFELCEINSVLKGLTYYSTLDLADEEHRKYEACLETIKKTLEEFDPTDVQKQQYLYVIRTQSSELEQKSDYIQKLESDISFLKQEKSRIVKEFENQLSLKNEKIELTNNLIKEFQTGIYDEISELQKQGIRLVSTNIFAVYPAKPELKNSENGFQYCVNAVTNREWISFLTMKGMADYSKAENGLDEPVQNLSFYDAASYCNWLSRLYGLPEFYSIEEDKIGFNNNSGYRLPFKSEMNEIQNEKIFSTFSETFSCWTNDFCVYSSSFGKLQILSEEIPPSMLKEKLAGLIIARSNDADK